MSNYCTYDTRTRILTYTACRFSWRKIVKYSKLTSTNLAKLYRINFNHKNIAKPVFGFKSSFIKFSQASQNSEQNFISFDDTR